VYWYVTNTPRKWIRLGTDYRRALARWAELEGGYTQETVATLLERFVALLEVKPSSLKQYRSWANALSDGLGKFPVNALQTYHVAQWRDANAHRKAYVNGCLATLRGAYGKAREWGWCQHDPIPKGFERAKRGRLLSHDELRRIRGHAVSWLQNAISLSYVTGLRESDVLGMRWADVEVVVNVRQRKTGTRQEFAINPALATVLEACKARKVLGLFVIADDKGRPITVRRLQKHYALARTRQE
jgi:integrase